MLRMFLAKHLGASCSQACNKSLRNLLAASQQCAGSSCYEAGPEPSTSGQPGQGGQRETVWNAQFIRWFTSSTSSHRMRRSAYQKFKSMADEYNRLQQRITDASHSGDGETIQRLSKRAGPLEPVASGYERLVRLDIEYLEALELEKQEQDPGVRQLAQEEQQQLQEQISELYGGLLLHLVPEEESDTRNVVMELRSGVGGQWAADFTGDLLDMYSRFCQRQGWRFEVIERSETDTGGIKAASVLITGSGAYGMLRFESGVHRVTDIPFTSSGKMQTATATVAVLPEASEVEVHIAEGDIRVDTFCASGPGGQHVNKTESAVRLTHIPTGIVVACQSERSQHQNKAKALQVLRSKVHEQELAKQQANMSAARQAATGKGNFNERIRSYYYQDARVCDHRCGLTINDVDKVLSGERLGDIIAAVQEHAHQRQLEEILENAAEEAEAAAG